MDTSLSNVLGSYSQGVAAVYLADYLKAMDIWLTPTKFSRERFSQLSGVWWSEVTDS
jgi:hypothetical protein